MPGGCEVKSTETGTEWWDRCFAGPCAARTAHAETEHRRIYQEQSVSENSHPQRWQERGAQPDFERHTKGQKACPHIEELSRVTEQHAAELRQQGLTKLQVLQAQPTREQLYRFWGRLREFQGRRAPGSCRNCGGAHQQAECPSAGTQLHSLAPPASSFGSGTDGSGSPPNAELSLIHI